MPTSDSAKSARYPPWVTRVVRPGQRLPDIEAMRCAIALGLANIEHEGGPFAAVLTAGSGEVVAVGFNQVVLRHDPTAHAEIEAIRRATQRLRRFSLVAQDGGVDSADDRYRLYTTGAPCVMCAGAIHWAGVGEVVAAARHADAEAIGFDEGADTLHLPDFFARRGIAYRQDVLRDEACVLYSRYRGRIYNAR